MKLASCFALSLLLCLTLAASGLELPITVTEPAGLDRQAEPVTGGIPLPAGQFKPGDGATFGLFDEQGQPIPLQVSEHVIGSHGDVSWILLDFQLDLKANQTRKLTLRSGVKPVAPPKALTVQRDAEGVSVDTGAAQFAIAATKPFSLFATASAGGKPVLAGGQISYTDAFDGKTYLAGTPEKIEVEYSGPMRTTVLAQGRFVGDDANKFQYIARVTAWAGHSEVYVKYALANSNPDHYCYRSVKESRVELKLVGTVSGTIVGAGKPVDAVAEAWMNQTSRAVRPVTDNEESVGTARWLQNAPGGGAKAMAGDKELWSSKGKGDVAEGWIVAKTAAGTIAVDDLYFVEDPPRQLAVAGGRLVLSGVADPLEGAQRPFSDGNRWLFDCSHLSSEYVIDLAASTDAAALSAAARRHRRTLFAMTEPSWYFDTAQLPCGEFGTQADEIKCYGEWDWKFQQKDIPTRPGGKLGLIPRWVAADDNHYTSEEDALDALLLMYLRTGQRSFLDGAQAWANHFMDLQTWRTDGWRYRDGGVWWLKQGGKGPLGNHPQRPKDPVTGQRDNLYGVWKGEKPFDAASRGDLYILAKAKACYCHNWGEGLVEWFMLTGDRDAYDSAIDTVEQNYDTQVRAFGKAPGKPAAFSRDFTRSCYLTDATRLIAAKDPFVVEASDYLTNVFLQRPDREPRGHLNGPSKVDMATIKSMTGPGGLAEMQRLGVTVDEKTGELIDPKSGARWKPLVAPHIWMYPPLSRAMEIYFRITDKEDVRDWMIAYGNFAGRVLYQPKHGNLDYGRMLVDFPLKGIAQDFASWNLPAGTTNGEGTYVNETGKTVPILINGYLGTFYPDVAARGYYYSGEPLLKQRAYDFWFASSHRGYNSPKLSNVGGVARWVNLNSTHDETVCFTGKTFWIWAHSRTDAQAPAAVTNLAVSVGGGRATVSFTAPADAGGGKVAEYQLKWSDKPIVDYEAFLKDWAANTDADVTNWFLAHNVAGEPTPAAGGKVSFTVEVPAEAKYFAVRSFDDSSNRSAISNVAEAK
ncbi:MAG: hypothetical protein BIFFINMI_03339 [Phycisphaerae bacterium]|nr:hypothetical protein [Phycisphaerae bacterium]